MSWSPTRRQVLATAGAIAGSTLAGCSGDATSSSPDCATEAIAHGDGDVIQEAMVVSRGTDLVLRVGLQAGADELDVDRILVEDGVGDGFVVPATDDRIYEQHVGERPLHGRYEIVALGEDDAGSDPVGPMGPQLDSLTIEFHCPSDGQED